MTILDLVREGGAEVFLKGHSLFWEEALGRYVVIKNVLLEDGAVQQITVRTTAFEEAAVEGLIDIINETDELSVTTETASEFAERINQAFASLGIAVKENKHA